MITLKRWETETPWEGINVGESHSPTSSIQPQKANPYPWWQHLEDTGCSVAPKCLECPLPRCIYEDGALDEIRSQRVEVRNQQIYSLRQQGLSVDEIAQLHGLSNRSVWRILKLNHGWGAKTHA